MSSFYGVLKCGFWGSVLGPHAGVVSTSPTFFSGSLPDLVFSSSTSLHPQPLVWKEKRGVGGGFLSFTEVEHMPHPAQSSKGSAGAG